VVLQKLKALASAAGDDWYYRFPVRNNRENRTDYVEGPSIKLANDLARLYGNCEVEVRVLDLGSEWMIHARFNDLETGFAMERPFQQRKSQRAMKGDEGRALDIALQIGVSKAIRNVVVNALQTFSDFAFQEAKFSLVDKIGKQLPQYRERVASRLTDRGIDTKRVEHVIGRVSGEWLAPDVARVIALMKSVEDGMATLDETFPPLAAPANADAKPESEGEKLDEFAKGSAEANAAGQGGDVARDNVKTTSEGAGEPQPLDKIEVARARGREARAKRMSAKAVPPEYREEGREAEAQAWKDGHAEEPKASE
jgi:hypothetical protein